MDANNTIALFPAKAKIPTEIQVLFGEPPVLRSESVNHYNDMMNKFRGLIKPNDLFEWWWVK